MPPWFSDIIEPEDASVPVGLPRAGKIGLGVKIVSEKTGKEYPREVDYFVLDDPSCKPIIEASAKAGLIDEAAAQEWRCGRKGPKKLPVIFPSPHISDVLTRQYERWGRSRAGNSILRCHGNGRVAYRLEGIGDEARQVKAPCPCDDLDDPDGCRLQCRLFFLVPVTVAGCFQIDTCSVVSMRSVRRDLEYVLSVFGQIHMLCREGKTTALYLEREPWTSSKDQRTHYAIRVRIREGISLQSALEIRAQATALTSPTQRPALPPPSEMPRSQGGNYTDGTPAPPISVPPDPHQAALDEINQIQPNGLPAGQPLVAPISQPAETAPESAGPTFSAGAGADIWAAETTVTEAVADPAYAAIWREAEISEDTAKVICRDLLEANGEITIMAFRDECNSIRAQRQPTATQAKGA